MKMTLVLWRTVSVWLCVAVVFVCLSSHVNCTEPHKEAQRPESPQEEGLDQTTDNKKPEPTQSIPDNLHLKDKEEQQQKNELVIKGGNQLEQQVLELEVPVEKEMTVAEEQIQDEHQQNSESPDPEASTGNVLDTPSSLPDSGQYSSFAAEFKHGSNQHIQEEIPNSISHSDAAVADVIDPDLPLANCEVEPNPFDSESSPPVVLENTSNAHTTGTKTISDPPLSSPAAHSTQHPEANVTHMLMEQDLNSPVSTETDASAGSKDPEDIPTFDEWKRKMMEVEKEKTVTTHTSNNGATHPVKKVPKNFNNYASVECGAKILGANPEAKSTSAILKENMDLYMLNPCSNKIWFIIELCEPIQVKQLDIANFELFSSTPKDFLVSISDRYPTNKWLKMGTFHARDERTVQSFPLDEQLYAKYVKMFTKYIKVELVSHFGSEHFCPLSLIRVFGTSMVEEYEEIADPSERPDDQDDDMDYPAGYAPGEVDPKNLIGSAKDAIFNIVKDIAVVLGGSQGNITSQEENMTEPSIQLETTSETTTTDLAPDPDLEDLSDTGTDSSDTKTPNPPVTDPNNEEHEEEEEQIVIPLEKDDEEPIESTITLLDEEEETNEDKENQRGSADYCELFPLSFPTCSCATSLHEYLIQQCLLHLPKKCQDRQTADKMQTAGDVEVPNWSIHQSSSFYPQIEQPQNGIFEDVEREQDSLSGHEKYIEISEHDHEMPASEPLPIEPSLTTDLTTLSATNSPTTKATPVVETPQLVTEEPVRKPKPEITLDSAAEEKHSEPTGTYSSALSAVTSASTAIEYSSPVLSQEKTNVDRQQEIKDTRDQNQDFYPETPQSKHHPEENILNDVMTEMPQPDTIPDPLPSEVNIIDSKIDDFAEDLTTTVSNSLPAAATPSLSDIYADPANGTEQSGNPLHGSSQKESVFMRLNNRIKALEMNMSLSGRYLEQLSQRYRKQMEEMQKAFNKTIIKLQNTSRVAEEQDLRQTESIQLLQGQLENVTLLVLNLSVIVSQLQNEVSDRESYLLLSLLLCLCMILLLYLNRCRTSSTSTPEPQSPSPESYTYCCPERHFSSEEAALKRSASYPLIHSESFQLASTMGPEILQHEETQSLCLASRKRRRRKLKSLENVETLKPSLHVAPEQLQTKGHVLCNGAPVLTDPTPLTQSLTQMLLEPTFRDSPSEGSSEGSSVSDDPSFCGISAACNRICDGLPPKTRAERRALRRRRPKPCGVVDYLKAPSRDKRHSLPIYTIQDIMDHPEQGSNTYGMNVNISGPV